MALELQKQSKQEYSVKLMINYHAQRHQKSSVVLSGFAKLD